MLTRDGFQERFGKRAVFGMVHVRALPGSPLFEGSMDAVIEAAVRDAVSLQDGGCAGLIVENFGDRPFHKESVESACIAALTRVVCEVRRAVAITCGVNVLRNDASAALSIAAATGASFIRVNVHVGAMLTDQGIIEGDAAETLRLRTRLAPDVAIFADHLVKHASPLVAYDPALLAKDLRLRGLADAVIVTGSETGGVADRLALESLRTVIDAPLLVGSGLTAENAGSFEVADGAIAGTWTKREGVVEGAVDPGRVRQLVAAFRGGV